MARVKISGPCHLCGFDGPLSFEHVPPRAAFNDRPLLGYKGEEMLTLGPGERPKGPGKISQRGAGAYTLCSKCNNRTGRWYGSRFAAWCYQGMEILMRTEGRPTLVYLHYLFPLAIIKQIATMFFSVNDHTFRKEHSELEAFVLDKERKGLSSGYRFYLYYNIEGQLRRSGVTARLQLTTNDILTYCELTFPPFGYVLTFGREPPDKRLFEISHFSRYGYEEFAVTEIRMPVLPTHLALPGDYRTREEIQRDYERNKDTSPEDV